uniref:Ycf1 n=1 Tax=Halimeda minima TaxID=170427 RepID=A0A386AYU3_9CHLO|nr:hypothetical protein Ycf1 [Halimeda minima]
MSLTETLKNTVEILNDIYNNGVGSPKGGPSFLIWNLFKDGLSYIISFQWANDFVKLPIFLPHESNSILADQIFSPNLSFLPSETVGSQSELSIIGFLNCFFLYFPLAPVQFIWLRRVIIDGPWAGAAATIGIIVGNLSLLGFCLFGFRDVLNIWFFSLWEPLSYFLGIWLIFVVIFQMTQKPLKIIKKYQKKELLMICITNFALVWTDQPGLYQFFGNLTLHTGISPLDAGLAEGGGLYFCGIVLGSVFWAPLIGFAFVQFGYLFPRITKYPYSVWIRSLNLFCLIGCITLTLTSFPYYGFDYLFANPLGFVPQDKSWNGLLELKTETSDANKGRLGEKSSYTSVDTDLSLFDRGSYGGGPFVELNIESLNYKKEYAWRSRFDRLSSRYLNLTRGGGLLAKYLQIEDSESIAPKPYGSAAEVARPLSESTTLRDQSPDAREAQLGEAELPDPRAITVQEQEEPAEDVDVSEEIDQLSYEDAEEAEDLIERFIEDYTAEANTEDTEIPDLPDEQMIKFSAFSEIAKYGFDLFSMFETVEVDPLDQQLAAELKEKYSSNFIYRFLVHFDISNFLKRQPYKLNSADEIALFENRLALGEYYNTLRSYSHLDLGEPVRATLFCGPKSYVNRIYNQQFKGTLKIVERLFSIHLEDEQNIPKLPAPEGGAREASGASGAFGGEPPLAVSGESKGLAKPGEVRSSSRKRDPSILKFDQPLYKTSLQNALVHEQLLEEWAFHEPVKETTPSPFFAGWDNEQRKFLITNRLLTRQNSPLLKSEDISFTTWPVTEEVLRNSPELSRLFRTREEILQNYPSADDLFKYAEPLMEEDTVIYEKLPNIIQRVELKNTEKLQTSLAPTRGGLIWAGNEPLKFKFQFLENFEKISNWFPKTNTKLKPPTPK